MLSLTDCPHASVIRVAEARGLVTGPMDRGWKRVNLPIDLVLGFNPATGSMRSICQICAPRNDSWVPLKSVRVTRGNEREAWLWIGVCPHCETVLWEITNHTVRKEGSR